MERRFVDNPNPQTPDREVDFPCNGCTVCCHHALIERLRAAETG